MTYIDTSKASVEFRKRAIDLERKAILITRFTNSKQETDFLYPSNCDGHGRIRTFKLGKGGTWPLNPLPILPARKALGLSPEAETIRAQVFQNSVCNWRCWYCFVDFALLKGDPNHSSFLTCDQLLDMYLHDALPPPMIDLSGGQPDLTPEWVPWMMDAILARGLEQRIFLWSDDNLSNDYFWRYLSKTQVATIRNYPMYARVCCFKGIDRESFSANTMAAPDLFDNQFELCKRLLELGLNLYFYVTLTAKSNSDFEKLIPGFLDRLQKIHRLLPLRIVPLEVKEYAPVSPRLNPALEDMMKGQYSAIKVWNRELSIRYSDAERATPITEINILGA